MRRAGGQLRWEQPDGGSRLLQLRARRALHQRGLQRYRERLRRRYPDLSTGVECQRRARLRDRLQLSLRADLRELLRLQPHFRRRHLPRRHQLQPDVCGEQLRPLHGSPSRRGKTLQRRRRLPRHLRGLRRKRRQPAGQHTVVRCCLPRPWRRELLQRLRPLRLLSLQPARLRPGSNGL